jgi:hypothetical protein
VGTVVTVELNTCYNACGRYCFKRNGLLCTFILAAVATLHVDGPQIVEMVHRSKAYPGPPSKTPSVPTVVSVR